MLIFCLLQVNFRSQVSGILRGLNHLSVLTYNFLLTYLDLNTATKPSVMDLVQETFNIVRADCKTLHLKLLYDLLNERVFRGRLPTNLPVLWVYNFIQTLGCYSVKRVRGLAFRFPTTIGGTILHARSWWVFSCTRCAMCSSQSTTLRNMTTARTSCVS